MLRILGFGAGGGRGVRRLGWWGRGWGWAGGLLSMLLEGEKGGG